MKNNEAYSGFFKHEKGQCICTVCGANASNATKIEHKPDCFVGKLMARSGFAVMSNISIEERISTLEHAIAEVDGKVETLNKLLKRLGADIGKLDASC